MKKSKAIELYGGEVKDLAAALDVSPQAVSQWPEELPDNRAKEIIGDAVLKFGVARVRAAFPEIRLTNRKPRRT